MNFVSSASVHNYCPRKAMIKYSRVRNTIHDSCLVMNTIISTVLFRMAKINDGVRNWFYRAQRNPRKGLLD